MSDYDFIIERKLVSAANQVTAGLDRDLQDLGLTRVQSQALFFFGSESGSSARDLARYLEITHQAARALAARLQEKGLIEQRSYDLDRRVRQFFLTAEGEVLYRQIREEHGRIDSRMLQGFSDEEKEVLYGFLNRLTIGDENPGDQT